MNLRGKHLAVIGAGNIGHILIGRLRAAGLPADHLVVCDNDPLKADAVAKKFCINTASLAVKTMDTADAILIAVPPKATPDLLRTLAINIRPEQVIISFAAAIPVDKIQSLLPAGIPVVRIMPNAPSLVGEGMNPVTYGASVTLEAQELVEAILTALGETLVVRDDLMNWCVGLTGAAMRSVLPVLEGMTLAGVQAGFSEAESRKMAAQVMLGTASLALKTDLTFEQIKALTPMETVDEAMLAQLFFNAAQAAQEKITSTQHKLWSEPTG